MIGGEWVNITFVDRDAHGPADCLAIFKLRHDNEHATEGQSAIGGHGIGEHTNNKKEEKSIKKCGS